MVSIMLWPLYPTDKASGIHSGNYLQNVKQNLNSAVGLAVVIIQHLNYSCEYLHADAS
jgi:hypothetical protein